MWNKESCRNGGGELRVASVAGRSAVVQACSRNPMVILTPRWGGSSAWAFTSSLGGGMVAGDETKLTVHVEAGARCFLGTQSSTKIYRNPAQLACSHRLEATVEEDALLVLAPDPVQCFAESRYDQRQSFTLTASSNLILIDWLSAGRVSRGERWAFTSYFSRNEVRRDNALIFLDPLLLDFCNGGKPNPFQTGRYNCFATVLLLGPRLAGFAHDILKMIGELPISPRSSLMLACSPCHEGLVLRLAGQSVEEVGKAIQQHLHFLPSVLGDNPWSRKW